MHKLTIIMISFVVSYLGHSQQLEDYSNSSNSYSINLKKGTTIQKKIGNGDLDIFITKENDAFKYAITIAEMPTNNTYESLFTKVYLEEFKQGCGCNISEYREVNYNHFKGLFYKMSKEEKGTLLKGYVISTVQKDKLFTITWMTIPSNFDVYFHEFQEIINTFRIN